VQNVCTKSILALAALDKWCNITKYTHTHKQNAQIKSENTKDTTISES